MRMCTKKSRLITNGCLQALTIGDETEGSKFYTKKLAWSINIWSVDGTRTVKLSEDILLNFKCKQGFSTKVRQIFGKKTNISRLEMKTILEIKDLVWRTSNLI